MARLRLALGEWGEVVVAEVPGQEAFKARARFRDFDGRVRLVEKRGRSTCFCRVEIRTDAGVLVATASVVYKVSAGEVDGPLGEPFAIAATRPLTPLATPRPGVTLDVTSHGPLAPNAPVTVTAAVANPSPLRSSLRYPSI